MWFKTPLEKLKIEQLQEEEMRTRNRIEEVRKKINALEEKKKKKFEEGIRADPIKQEMLIQEMQQIDLEGKLNFKHFSVLHRQYTVITNLLTIKKFENQLKKSPVWKKIGKMTPEELEKYLIHINIEGGIVEQALDNIISTIERGVTEDEKIEENEKAKKIKDTWKAIKSGQIGLEEALREIKLEPEEKETA